MNRYNALKPISRKSPTASAQSVGSSRTLPGMAFLIALTLAVYWPAARCGYIWDDNAYVQNNLHLRTFEGLKTIWFDTRATPQYYPLVHTTFWLEYHLWKLHPAGYHIVNIVLHSLSAILLWQVLLKLKIPGAWAAAAIFAVHPVTVESVAWITERKNVLSGVFYLAATLAYLKFALGDTQITTHPKKWYFIALILFICALLGKTVTATLPGALLLILWWKRDRLHWRDIGSLIPFFVIGAAMGLFTAWLEVDHVGAKGEEWTLTPIERFLVAGRALCFYATKIVWPHPLIFFYERWNVSQEVWQQYLYMIPFPAVVITFWFLRKRLGKGPVVAALFFAGTLFPALGFLDVYPMRFSYVADHFQYLAIIGIITLIVAAGASLTKRYPKQLKTPLLLLLIIVLSACSVLTAKQCAVYTNLETLWTDIIEKRPDPWMAYNNLGLIKIQQNKFDEAIMCFKETLKSQPNNMNALNNLVQLYRLQNRMDLAEAYAQKALNNDRESYKILYTYSLILSDQGKNDEAIDMLHQCLEVKPDYDIAHLQMAQLLSGLGRYEQALEQVTYVVDRNACFPDALMTLADLCQKQNQVNKAIVAYQKILEINPQYPQAINALALIRGADPDPDIRNPKQALELAIRCCRITNYQNAFCLDTLGIAYAANGDFDQAGLTAQKAIEYARSGRLDQLADDIEIRMTLYRQRTAYIRSTPRHTGDH